MNFDIDRISEQINAFWSDYGNVVIATAGVLVLALLVVSVVKIGRSRQRDRWVGGLTALVVLAWTSEGLWEVARYTLALPLGFAVMTFFVYEAMMLTAALQAERYRKHHPSPGPAGRFVWILASITASIVALNASTLVEALLRFSLPLTAAGLWWVGVTTEREDDSDEVKRLRDKERAKRKATWAIDLRRPMVAVGVMRAGEQTLTDAERERRIRQMVTAADELHAAPPSSRQANRAMKRLRKLARLATANDIAAVRARVARTTRIAELIMPSADLVSIIGSGTAAIESGDGHVSQVDSSDSKPAGDRSAEPPHDQSGGTGLFHPDTLEADSRNGVVPGEHDWGTDSHDRGRPAAERVFRASLRAGRPLSAREVARLAGCSPTTAWRAMRDVKGASDTAPLNGTRPDGATPDEGVLVRR